MKRFTKVRLVEIFVWTVFLYCFFNIGYLVQSYTHSMPRVATPASGNTVAVRGFSNKTIYLTRPEFEKWKLAHYKVFGAAGLLAGVGRFSLGFRKQSTNWKLENPVLAREVGIQNSTWKVLV
jgi:hypothetical protein